MSVLSVCASVLTIQFGVRSTTVFGAVIAATGSIAAALIGQYWSFCLFYGLFVGAGEAMMLVPVSQLHGTEDVCRCPLFTLGYSSDSILLPTESRLSCHSVGSKRRIDWNVRSSISASIPSRYLWTTRCYSLGELHMVERGSSWSTVRQRSDNDRR